MVVREFCRAGSLTSILGFEATLTPWLRDIAASPTKVFAVLREPRGDVAIDSSGMLQSTDGQRVGQVGDEFVVHMDRESLNDLPMGKYDVTVIITRFVADAEIE